MGGVDAVERLPATWNAAVADGRTPTDGRIGVVRTVVDTPGQLQRSDAVARHRR